MNRQERRILVTGDLHGDLSRLSRAAFPHELLNYQDFCIVCGDFGMIMHHNDLRDQQKLDWIESHLNCTLLFVDGNHECHPALKNFPIVDFWGGKAHKIRQKIYHLVRGEIYNFHDETYNTEGFRVFAFGGAHSIDRPWRRPGVDWWPEELPSQEEFDRGWENLKSCDYRVDCIITHCAPAETQEKLLELGVIRGIDKEEASLNSFLDAVSRKVSYKQWFMGHYHRDLPLWRNQQVVYWDYYDARTGEKL